MDNLSERAGARGWTVRSCELDYFFTFWKSHSKLVESTIPGCLITRCRQLGTRFGRGDTDPGFAWDSDLPFHEVH